jgi:hypothetical protein
LRRPTPPTESGSGQPRCNSSSGDALGSPRSWHHFGRVGPDGCPGFKGPVPQPVSMSGSKFRCGGTFAQGTGVQPRRLHAWEAGLSPSVRRQHRLRSGREIGTTRSAPAVSPVRTRSENRARHGRRARSPPGRVYGVFRGASGPEMTMAPASFLPSPRARSGGAAGAATTVAGLPAVSSGCAPRSNVLTC